MLRTSLVVAVMAMSFATSADAFIVGNIVTLNGTYSNLMGLNGTYSNIITYNVVGPNGYQLQGVSMNGRALASSPTVGPSAGATDAGPRVAPAETSPLAVEAVILPTGETVDLR